MQVKMIVTDLDRTLLQTDKTLSAYTCQALKRCQAKGIIVAFATARSEKASERFTAVCKPDVMIVNGGALARFGDTVLHQRLLSKDTVNRLIKRMHGEKSVGYITVDTPNGYFVNHPIDPSHAGWQDYLHAKYTDFSNDFEHDAYKLTVQFFDANLPYAITKDFQEVDLLPFSEEEWVRLAHHHATKWRAVSACAQHFGIDPTNIVAFGDDYNDIEMIEKCGVGVAVENAISQVKAVADCICDVSDKDGVAKWLEEKVCRIIGGT